MAPLARCQGRQASSGCPAPSSCLVPRLSRGAQGLVNALLHQRGPSCSRLTGWHCQQLPAAVPRRGREVSCDAGTAFPRNLSPSSEHRGFPPGRRYMDSEARSKEMRIENRSKKLLDVEQAQSCLDTRTGDPKACPTPCSPRSKHLALLRASVPQSGGDLRLPSRKARGCAPSKVPHGLD